MAKVYYEAAIPSGNIVLKSGEVISIKNYIVEADEADEKELPGFQLVKMSEEKYKQLRARQAMQNPEDELRAQIRAEELAKLQLEMAANAPAGTISTTATAGFAQDTFRPSETTPVISPAQLDAEVDKSLKVAPTTTAAIAAAVSKK